jgi:hypothetical protein
MTLTTYEDSIGDTREPTNHFEGEQSTARAIFAGFRGKHGRATVFADGNRFGVLVDGDQRYSFDTLKQATTFARNRAFVAPQVAS